MRIRDFIISSWWKRLLFAIIFAWLFKELCQFWNGWQEGHTSIFYFIHAPVHEVGHAVAQMFRLPEVLVVLAGSLFQILTPCFIAIYFIYHHDFSAIALCLGWLGCATIETATYMADAIDMNLPLVAPFSNGENLIHDWNAIFTHWGCLNHAQTIADITAFCGFAFLIVALVAIIAMLALGFVPQNTENSAEK